MNELSSETRTLLKAAKAEGPSAGARAQIWGGVSSTVASTAGFAGTGVMVGTKLLGVLAGALTVGLAAFALHIAGAPPVESDLGLRSPGLQGQLRGGPTAASDLEMISVVAPAPVDTPEPSPQTPPSPQTSKVTSASAAPVRARGAPVKIANEDPLMRESLLVAEARGALKRNDPAAALSIIHSARAIEGRSLEPEELSIEVAALRALGRESEAGPVEMTLRLRYPDHALSR